MRTPKAYVYNPNTKALHITGFCKDAHGGKSFDSEREAIRFAGRQLYFCTLCEEKREKLVREKVKQLQEGVEK